MHDPGFLSVFFAIFATAALVATAALALRLPLLIAYIAVGALLGPSGLDVIGDPGVVEGLSHTGIVFLLFLLGLDMQPASLAHTLRQTLLVGVASTLALTAIGAGLALLLGLAPVPALVTGAALSFSSTILGIKLLPTTSLHHRPVGELTVSLLLLQDLFAIALLLALDWQGPDSLWSFAALPALIGAAVLLVRHVLVPLLDRFDVFHEYVFLTAIGWCLAVAWVAGALGLSAEMGAFVGGISLATHPVAQYIAESLKPLRDFFLIFFFCSVGASLPLGAAADVLPAAATLALVLLVLKPLVLGGLLRLTGTRTRLAREVGVRLGQASEFALLVAVLALGQGLLSERDAVLVQMTTLLTFMASSYLIVLRYPSPIALTDRLRRD